MSIKFLSKCDYNKFRGIINVQRLYASVDVNSVEQQPKVERKTGAPMGITEKGESEGYFQVNSKRLLEIFRNQLKGELFEHECQIRLHNEAIERHKNRILDLKELVKNHSELD